ncbi:hypothetical protein [Nocardioides plantarum]|uniref:Sulfotransferase family protein n=1 Tax=Nocardioides plantarum TaxID=29299 RepID=A0ABV5KA78_9ACTN|nr:hypothetical protein [Nocardioides plantarum]
MNKVVVVAGPGRSGTSALAGILSHLGTRVSRPHLPADERTDQPSFETKWVVEHHLALMRRDPLVRALDTRPGAADLARRLTTAEDEVALNHWLGGVLHDAPTGQVVVNDPRAFWFHDHWTSVVDRLGADLGYLVLLSDPVGFVRARDVLKDDADRDPGSRRQRDTAFLAEWVHSLLVVEESTRQDVRAFVRHADLLADWRPAVSALAERVGLALDLEGGGAAVDDLVGSVPAESTPGWDEVDVPDTLRDIAVRLWEQLGRLADDPADPSVPEALAVLRTDYDRVFDHALGVATDHTATREMYVGRRTRASVTSKFESQIAELEQQLEEARGGRGDDEADDRSRGGLGSRWRG